MVKRLFFPLFIPLLVLVSGSIVFAQSEQPTLVPSPSITPTPTPGADDPIEDAGIPLYHIVASGETLTSIAELYGVEIETLQQVNGIVDARFLAIGQKLLIPGGGGDLVATVHVVQLGDTIKGIAAAYSTTVEKIAADNYLVSTNNIAAGRPLTVLSRTGSSDPASVTGIDYIVQPGETLTSIALKFGTMPAAIADLNDLLHPQYLLPFQRLYLPSELPYQSLPGNWHQIRMSRTPLTQGETAAIYIETISGDMITGSFAGRELKFTEFANGDLALVGLDAFTEPGFYSLELLSGNGPDEEPFQQHVQVNSGNYGIQYITIPEELNNLLEPEVRAADEAILAPYFEQYSEPFLWSGLFQSPVSDTIITAAYGASRSYNEGPIEIYHTGVDYAGTVGTPIQAPAEGIAIFSDTLPLHGGTLIIDHGIGVMTAYYHLSEILVNPGDLVKLGEPIAYGGSTGLSSGPHLHWDLRVNNVPVNGLQWLEEDIIQYALEQATNTAPSGGGP